LPCPPINNTLIGHQWWIWDQCIARVVLIPQLGTPCLKRKQHGNKEKIDLKKEQRIMQSLLFPTTFSFCINFVVVPCI
jgi:hypothetical protein